MSKISIVVPVFNKSEYIDKTLSSILSQTYDDFELLLIDDGSTDSSSRICDEYALRDARVRTYHTANCGVSAARNLGIRNATGKYICFIDADDLVEPSFLEKLYLAASENDSCLSVCGYCEIKNAVKTVHDYDIGEGDRLLYDIIRQDLLCILWNKLFVREKIRHMFDESISTCEDSLFCLLYYYDNKPDIAVVNETLYTYSVHADGLTSSYQDRAFNGINSLLKINLKIARAINDEKIKKAALHHIFKVYFCGVYMYIFENLCKGRISAEKISVAGQVINDRNYQRIMRHILKIRMTEKEVEKTGLFEYLIIIFSILKFKRTILYLSKVKICLKRLMNL